MRIEIVTSIENDNLNQCKYTFFYNSEKNEICLRFFSIQNRKTTKHKFQTVKYFDNFDRNSNMNREEIEISDIIKNKVTEEIISRIKNNLIFS